MEAKWVELLKQKTDPNDPQGRFRSFLLKLAMRYNRLAALAFGFQHSFEKASADDIKTSFFRRVSKTASIKFIPLLIYSHLVLQCCGGHHQCL